MERILFMVFVALGVLALYRLTDKPLGRRIKKYEEEKR
jgi:hypothetical protein